MCIKDANNQNSIDIYISGTKKSFACGLTYLWSKVLRTVPCEVCKLPSMQPPEYAPSARMCPCAAHFIKYASGVTCGRVGIPQCFSARHQQQPWQDVCSSRNLLTVSDAGALAFKVSFFAVILTCSFTLFDAVAPQMGLFLLPPAPRSHARHLKAVGSAISPQKLQSPCRRWRAAWMVKWWRLPLSGHLLRQRQPSS